MALSLPMGGVKYSLGFVIMIRKCSCLQKHYHHCLSLVFCSTCALCHLCPSTFKWITFFLASKTTLLLSSFTLSVIFLSVSLSCCLLSLYSRPALRAVHQVQPTIHSNSTAMSPAIYFLSFILFSCRLTCCRLLFTHSVSVSIRLNLFFCCLSCFPLHCTTFSCKAF